MNSAQLVDLARAEERAGELRPALDQQRGDPAAAELVERGADPPSRSPASSITSAPASRSAATRSGSARGAGQHVERRGPRPSARAPSRAAAARPSRRRRAPAGAASGSSTSRAVSSGSSASAVPIPTATASDSARQRWTSARLSGPEIHRRVAARGRGEAVEADAPTSASPAAGRCARACETAGSRAGRPRPRRRRRSATSTPLVAEDPRAAAARLLARVVGADHDPGDPGGEDRVGARRLAALVGAGLERDVHRRPGRVVAARAAVGERRDLGVRGRRAARDGPRRSPRRRAAITAPTSGFGLTCAAAPLGELRAPAGAGPDPRLWRRNSS